MADSPILPDIQQTNLTILASSEAFSGVYDELEVWRAVSPSVVYQEITGPSWRAARLPQGGGDEPSVAIPGPVVNVVGHTLSVIARNGDFSQLDFTFIGSLGTLLKDVAIQLTSQSGGRLRSYVDIDQHLVIETASTGPSTYLQVLPTDAAIFLDLPTELPDSEAYGKARRISLQIGVNQYEFVDQFGAPTATYRTRFRNSLSGLVSDFSVSFTSAQAIGLSQASLVTGFLSLVSSDGKPRPHIEVTVRSTFRGQLVEGKLLAGGDLVDSTNSEGYVEFELVRGQPYTLGIVGTNIVKDFTAPTDSSITAFQLLDPAYSDTMDYFQARVPNLPTLARGSI